MAEITLSPDNPLLKPGSVTLAPVRTKSDSRGPQLARLHYRSAVATIPVVCHRRDLRAGTQHQVLTWTSTEAAITGQAGAVYLIQRSSGCRVSEALALTTGDIVLPDLLIIKALKGSRPRTIRIPEFKDQFSRLLSLGNHPLFRVSYSHVYRQYLNAGIVEIRPDSCHNRVTHSLRKNFIQSVHSASKDVGLTADLVGHKSKRSTIIYLKKGTRNG